jgi:hypothetical protein
MADNIIKYHLKISLGLLKNHFKMLLLCLMWINFAVWCPIRTASGETFSKNSWQNLETRYTVIQYQTLKDLKEFNGRIDYSPDDWGLKSLFSGSKDPVESITKKVDAVFEKAQKILDMRQGIKKVVIRIYPDKKHFHEVQYLAGREKSRLQAWYIFEQNTIYLNNDDVHEGILAHEIAHAIIDHYLTVRPPKAAAEILARYVDEHLHY